MARNFLSTYPTSGGTTLVPGISNEGWAQCPNPACTWCNRLAAGGATAFEPHIHLSHVVRNNAQSVSPLYPPPALQFSTQDRKGRLFAKRSPGERCPFCGSTLQSMAYFTGVVMLSPRENDGTFSYTDDGEEPLWESMIFYCPFRYSSGESEIRRYVFFASQWNANASLVDLMDFDDNGLIETPPMTDTNGDFVLDADGELFCFVDGGTGSANWLYFLRWDSATSRYFRIYVNRTTGTALVTVNGGTYGDGVTRQFSLLMERYATGVADFDVSHFINNPSYESAGATVNPEGVAELSGVRFTVVTDRENTRSEDPWNPSRPSCFDRGIETMETMKMKFSDDGKRDAPVDPEKEGREPRGFSRKCRILGNALIDTLIHPGKGLPLALFVVLLLAVSGIAIQEKENGPESRTRTFNPVVLNENRLWQWSNVVEELARMKQQRRIELPARTLAELMTWARTDCEALEALLGRDRFERFVGVGLSVDEARRDFRAKAEYELRISETLPDSVQSVPMDHGNRLNLSAYDTSPRCSPAEARNLIVYEENMDLVEDALDKLLPGRPTLVPAWGVASHDDFKNDRKNAKPPRKLKWRTVSRSRYGPRILRKH